MISPPREETNVEKFIILLLRDLIVEKRPNAIRHRHFMRLPHLPVAKRNALCSSFAGSPLPMERP